jgi:LisH domain-containing protein ARMC9
LPYIPNLMDHPAFKNIFKVKWLNSLKEKLGAYFGKKPSTNPCILQLMYEKYIEADKYSNTAPDKQLLSQIHSLENQLAIANEEKAKIKEKLHKLEEYSEEYTNGLLLVAKDLYKTIESAKQGKNITDAVVSSAYSSLSKYDNNLTLSVLKDSKPVLLNFASIIKDLTSLQDDLQICALLQALRWRLTRSTRAFRKENLENFIRFNILCTIKPHDTLIDNLLLSTRRVKEFTIRLLNVITSEKTGRAYLLQKENIVSLLVETLYSEKQDNLLRQNSLGVLQKLSLKKTAQIEMIKLDVLDWLLKILKHDTDRIADYTLEYATALLMNLSLRTLGKDKLARNPNDVINMLNKFIAHENNQVRTYINGTLYSILTRKTLKDAALRLNIEKKLKSLRNKSEDNIKRQISFILEQLKSDDNECPTDDTEEEIEENLESESEDEEIIPDDEDMDDVLNIPNLLIGEELLKEKYEKNKSLSAASSKRELEESKEIVRVKRPESNRNKNTSKVTPAKDSSDYSKGFISRDKIPRTPLQF